MQKLKFYQNHPHTALKQHQPCAPMYSSNLVLNKNDDNFVTWCTCLFIKGKHKSISMEVYGSWQPSKIFFLLSVQSSLFTSYFSPESIECFIEGQAFRGRMIWLHAHPFPPYIPSVSSTSDHTGRPRNRENLLTGEVGKGRAWIRIIRPQESLDLYKSVNDLC